MVPTFSNATYKISWRWQGYKPSTSSKQLNRQPFLSDLMVSDATAKWFSDLLEPTSDAWSEAEGYKRLD